MTPDLLVHILLTGVGATLCMDLWALLLKRRFGIPSLDYALVGRWFLGMFDGRWFHATIVTAPPRRGENNRLDIALRRRHRVCLYPDRFGGHQVVYGAGAAHRTVERLAELAAPFLVMQPALGFGVAAAKTAYPRKARLLSLLTHTVYGLGLLIAARLLAALYA